ncbi:MAG: GNAT family N-acetyltransferase [Candidatus Aminicenantes bacterium]|nr:GNAT family N-acetyltransferase [Candidatus Aminicenantes bacterium]
MEKAEKLKDGREVTIRRLALYDLDRLMSFYQKLPLEDRKYLKFDVTNRNVVARRLKRIETGDDIRVIALLNDEIIASGALELSGEQWSKHQGEIRVIIARDFQHEGLGTLIIRELYFIAIQNNVETIVARMMRPQVNAQKIFRKLGFREEMLLPDFVKDLEGAPQDMIIMTCSVKNLWKELDHLFSESDWQRCR